MHTHEDFCELTIVLSGSAIHVVNNERFVVNKGDVFIINKDIAHGYEKPQDFKICNIMYRYEEMFPMDHAIRKLAGFHALFVLEPYLNADYHFTNRLHLSLIDFDIVSSSIEEMIREYNSKLEGFTTILRAEFIRLSVLLSRLYCVPRAQNISPSGEQMMSMQSLSVAQKTDTILSLAVVISYMEQHFADSITLTELAKMMNVSVRHFTRLFEKMYHISPGNYLKQLRIQYACVLLKDRGLTIAEVAGRTGYGDSNYFARHFKKITGFTPGQYRKTVWFSQIEQQ